jgi:lysophospholipase L1-like esterase
MISLVLTSIILVPAAPAADDLLVFQNGDRVVLLGGTLIEREQKFGYWETALTLKNAGKSVVFRNLGWSGDTVRCESRGSFGGQPEGFKKTLELVKELKPTVIIVCYGHVESFDGKSGVPKFIENTNKLLDSLKPMNARIVLMTPTPFQNAGATRNADVLNAQLADYATAFKQIAQERKLGLVDLYTQLAQGPTPSTDNGLHLNEKGYEETARLFGGSPTNPHPDLRAKIVEKNELFFHRWRPQNQTYLFGFRKHEQGNNAKEVAEFDPLVATAEKEIQKLLISK